MVASASNVGAAELGEPCMFDTDCTSLFCDPADDTCACDEHADCPGANLCNEVSDPNVCVPAGCPNNVVETGEGCDDGNLDNGDGCNEFCLRELGQPCTMPGECASNHCDPSNACACDDNADCPESYSCLLTTDPNMCVLAGCGNTIVESSEGCDDGGTANGDGCDESCFRENGFACSASEQCASAFCDPFNNTCACDEVADCAFGMSCNVTANPNVCVAIGCGNSVVEASEGCDDGNTNPSDGCSATCLIELGQNCTAAAACASDFCDPANDTCACNDSGDCPASQTCNQSPNPNVCIAFGCGNGFVEGSEACDDGNTSPGDGCDASCLRELGQLCVQSAQCASAFCDVANDSCACDANADCASGFVCNTAPSPNTCVPPGCSNGVIETGEGCDDGNNVNGDGCNDDCKREPGASCVVTSDCANGHCDSANNTCTCDSDDDCAGGQRCATAAAPNACVARGCGNGLADPNEGCDDGNNIDGDGCTVACKRELGQSCAAATECASNFCDQSCGCNDSGDCGGDMLCDIVIHACIAPGCGNGLLESGELCDDGNTADGDDCSATCEPTTTDSGGCCSTSGTPLSRQLPVWLVAALLLRRRRRRNR